MDVAELQQWIERHPVLAAIIAAWMLAWKGVALWRAAERNEKGWFVALLLINTLGLLEMFYVIFWIKRTRDAHGDVFKRI